MMSTGVRQCGFIRLFGLFGTGTNIETYDDTHDAWNRLVGVEYGQTVRGSYVYNGLNWRIMKQADTDGTGGPDQQRLMHDSDAPGMRQLPVPVHDAQDTRTGKRELSRLTHH